MLRRSRELVDGGRRAAARCLSLVGAAPSFLQGLKIRHSIPLDQTIRKIVFNRGRVWRMEAAGRLREIPDEFDCCAAQQQPAAGRSDLDVGARRGARSRRARSAAVGLPLFVDPQPRDAGRSGHPPHLRTAQPSRFRRRHHPPHVQGDAARPARMGRHRAHRHPGLLRPRSGLRPLPDAGALFQGLPCDPDAPAGALAVDARAQGFRALSAEPLVGGVPDRHPSGLEDGQGHLHRPCHRAGGRRDRGHRGQCLDPAWRDARRHRQGRHRSPSRRSATAC